MDLTTTHANSNYFLIKKLTTISKKIYGKKCQKINNKNNKNSKSRGRFNLIMVCKQPFQGADPNGRPASICLAGAGRWKEVWGATRRNTWPLGVVGLMQKKEGDNVMFISRWKW